MSQSSCTILLSAIFYCLINDHNLADASSVKQPMLVYEFLKAFNQKLDPAASRAVGAAKKVAAASKAILLGRQNGLHRMTAFGLKYCHISKKSVGLLEVLLLRCLLSIIFWVNLFRTVLRSRRP